MESTESRWSLSSVGNRVLLAVVLALVVFVPTRSIWAGIVVGAIAFLLATVVATLTSRSRT